MSTGRYILRGYASQGWRAAGRALADLGVTPATRFGRFAAGELYQSGIRAGQAYQSGLRVSAVYQSGILQGQVR
jgi:hypothetical protein